jgi:hypothetical protein
MRRNEYLCAQVGKSVLKVRRVRTSTDDNLRRRVTDCTRFLVKIAGFAHARPFAHLPATFIERREVSACQRGTGPDITINNKQHIGVTPVAPPTGRQPGLLLNDLLMTDL